jgi:hypothetical protein
MNARPRRALVGGLLAVVVINLGFGGAVVGHDLARSGGHHGSTEANRHFRSVPEQSTNSPDGLRANAVTKLLAERATAIRTHNRQTFLAGIDPQSTRFRKAQVTYFNNLRQVPFSSWSYSLDGQNEAPTDGSQFLRYDAPVWLPHVVLHYEIAGFDRAPTSLDMYYTFVHRGSRWYIGSDSDDAKLALVTARDIWDFGPVVVVHGRRVIVLGHPNSRVSLSALAAEADRDVPRVSAVWGTGWSQRVVVLAPSTASELSKLLVDGGDLSQIAAVATAELIETSHQSRPVGDRVLINPNNYVRLNAKGRQVVITHEITHVASRPQTGPLLPDWLVEGLADYVGYLDLNPPATVAAHALKVWIDGGHHLSALPTDAAYDGANKHLALAYDESWLACRYVAGHWGQATLVRLYRTVGAATDGTQQSAVDAGVRVVLHEPLTTFTRQWQTSVGAVLH